MKMLSLNSVHYTSTLLSTPVTTSAATVPSPSVLPSTLGQQLRSKFTKEMCCTLSDYPNFKEDKFWMSFKLKVATIAATHRCNEGLDHNYVPDSLSTGL